MNTFLVLGDSVAWGQGLLDADKFSTAVFRRLQQQNPALNLRVAAHSGATIGWNAAPGVPVAGQPGEVPVSSPTIRQQVETFGADGADPGVVSHILLTGGINDVDLRVLLNPLVPQDQIDQATVAHCGADMEYLLLLVGQQFTQATVCVIGYYPILSYASDPLGIEALFKAVHAWEFQPLVDGTLVKNAIVDHCLRFWSLANQQIEGAVEVANRAGNAARFRYVDPGFGLNNAVFAPATLLWGVSPEVPFAANDEVVGSRTIACGAACLDPSRTLPVSVRLPVIRTWPGRHRSLAT